MSNTPFNFRSGLRMIAQRSEYSFGYEFFLFDDYSKKRLSCEPVVISEVADGKRAVPLLRIDEEHIQELFDSLYRAGLRPSKQDDTSSVVKAQTAHIEDLRKAFDVLMAKVNQPPLAPIIHMPDLYNEGTK